VPLLEAARYKGAYGGRGSGKSHFFAGHEIDDSIRISGCRTVCIREVQKSLRDSAKQLMEDKIRGLGLLRAGSGFQIYHDRIVTPGDGIIVFHGMNDHNAESVKSLEGFNRAWVEEAQTLSERSLKLLRPTIRAPGSELHFSWNPRRKNDPVDMMFRGGKPPTGAISVRANWNHNPWFTPELEQERQDCLNNEPEEYDHIWDGGYAVVTKGAYYAKALAAAKAQGRIGRVSADPLLSYRVYVDIGGTGAKSDAFAMWVVQFVAREIRVLNYYEAVGQELGDHLHWLRNSGYTPDNTGIWLPHDGGTNDRVYRVSYESAFKDAGYKVTVIPNQGTGAAMKRIEEARRIFPMCWFNEETCRPGLEALGWYHEKWDENRNIGLGPEHDWASHGADGFGLMAVAYEAPRAGPRRPPKTRRMANQRLGRF